MQQPSLARRSVQSAKWTVFSSLAGVVMSFIQALLLSRLLPVEVFGVYAVASSTVLLVISNASFGMGVALLQRTDETEDFERALSVHFTLKLIFTVVLVSVVLAGALLAGAQEHDLQLALIVIALADATLFMTQTATMALSRQVAYRRIAVIDLISKLVTVILSIALALSGHYLWALLVSNVVNMAVTVTGVYIWRPVWRPRLAWHWPTVRYLLGFGSKNTFANWLAKALDNVDDLWAGAFLGAEQTGFYAPAYRFARYPAYILASPISNVASGTYAALKGDRETLSQAFLRSNALVVRTGFLLAGVIALIAPAFIIFLLGERWLPMLSAFRLMLIYSLFEPMKSTMAMLFLGMGDPQKLVRIRFIQLVVLVVGLFVLGTPFGIEGVALAVDIMLVVGIVLLLHYARIYVDVPYRRLLLGPLLGVGVGFALSLVLEILLVDVGLLWRNMICAGSFALAYLLGLWLWDRPQILDLWHIIGKHLWK